MWPSDSAGLVALQHELAGRSAEPWSRPPGSLLVGGCWVCFPRGLTGPGNAGHRAWAAAVVLRGGQPLDQSLRLGEATAPYVAGLLALRIGIVLEAAVRGLRTRPEVLLVNATGSDHPRRAGLATHLGAVLELPTVGVTHRPLTGEGRWPADRRGAASLVRIGDEVVGSWVRTRRGARPVLVHPGWRLGLDDAVELVLEVTPRRRTPQSRVGAWFVPAAPARERPALGLAMLVAPGGGNRAGRVGLAEELRDACSPYLLMDCRGYGGNPGRPSEEGLVRDAMAAVEALEDLGYLAERTIYFGSRAAVSWRRCRRDGSRRGSCCGRRSPSAPMSGPALPMAGGEAAAA